MSHDPEWAARARSFGANADAYERTRPTYPEDAVRWLVGDEPKRVLDLGAGTGKLTRSLVALGHEVIAVEPSPEMIGQLRAALPEVDVLKGAAERIPVPDARFDIVTVGDAFHWFHVGAALPEIARVLRQGGTLGLVWNNWNPENPLVSRLYDVLPEPAASGNSNDPSALGDRFGPLEQAAFSWVRPYKRQDLVDRVGTQSSVATLESVARAECLEAVGRFWDAESTEGLLAVPYRTDAYRADRL